MTSQGVNLGSSAVETHQGGLALVMTVRWSCSPVAGQRSGKSWDRTGQSGTPRRCGTCGGGGWSGGRPKVAVVDEALTAEEGVCGTCA
jgi:hypothetical protein